MKKIRKIMVLVIASIMVLALAAPAMAAPTITKNPEDLTGPASITVTLPTVENGATANNTYKIYKVFDAVTTNGADAGISYSLVDGKTAPPAAGTLSKFDVDSAGNVLYYTRATADDEWTLNNSATALTDSDITNIKAYVTEAMLAATVTTTAADTSFTVEDLPYGYYYITTTTGTVVTVNSTKPNANVADKNEVPPVTKVISDTDKGSYDADGKKALAEVGSDVTYTATITKKKGAENYVFHDTMDTTLSYNNDVKVYSNAECTEEVATTNYDKTVAAGDTLTVSFDNTYIAGLADDAVLYIRYTAKITSAALQDNPAKNTAKLSYGHTPGSNSTPVVQTETYNAEISVLKKNGKGTDATTDDTPLSGAGFKLYKLGTKEVPCEEGDAEYNADPTQNGKKIVPDTENKLYYHLDTTVTPNVVSWGTKDAGDQHVSDAEGKVPAFTGLPDGTYYLEETQVPSGFNAAADTEVTIAAHNYTAANLKQEATVINNQGSVLPSTGGIGTTIFYVLGAVLVIGAGVLLVTRRRMSND